MGLLRINKLLLETSRRNYRDRRPGEQMHGDPKSVTFAQPVSSILELRSKRNPRESFPRKRRGGDGLRVAKPHHLRERYRDARRISSLSSPPTSPDRSLVKGLIGYWAKV